MVKQDDKVLIVSDMHLGLGDLDDSIDLFNRLKEESSSYDIIILNGDILETWKYGSLGITVDYRESKIKELFKAIPGLEDFFNRPNVHIILGNHDYSLSKLGYTTKSITLFKNGKIFFITHGNDCDYKTSFKYLDKQSSWWVIMGSWLVSKISELISFFNIKDIKDSEEDINNLFYSYNGSDSMILKYVDDISKRLNSNGCYYIILSHTHIPMKRYVDSNILYYNTGTYSTGRYDKLVI